MSTKVSTKQHENNDASIEQQFAEFYLHKQPESETKVKKKNENQGAGSEPGTEFEDDQKQDGDTGENVKVMVRCRPPGKGSDFSGPTSTSAYASASASTSRSSSSQENYVIVREEDKCVEVEGRQFYFDDVFGPDSNNERVYMKSARQLVEFAFQGYNCTVFLYGQTGTGKTYTHSSISLNSFAHIFSLIRDSKTHTRFLIRASYFELYNEVIRDLLVSTFWRCFGSNLLMS